MIFQIGNRRPRNNTGFTLIELVLVILLISILTALSTPLFRRTFSDLILRNAALDMAKLINYAQEMAIIEKVNYKVNFNFEERKYWLTRQKPEGVSYERIKGRYGKPFSLSRDLELSSDKEEGFILYPDGRSDKAKIEIRDKKNKWGRRLHVKGFGTQIEIEVLER